MIEEKEKLLNAVTEDMNTIRNILEGAENEKQGLTESLTSSQQQCQELKIQLEDAIQEKINAVQSVSEQLSNEFKIKINQLEEELNRVRVCNLGLKACMALKFDATADAVVNYQA